MRMCDNGYKFSYEKLAATYKAPQTHWFFFDENKEDAEVRRPQVITRLSPTISFGKCVVPIAVVSEVWLKVSEPSLNLDN